MKKTATLIPGEKELQTSLAREADDLAEAVAMVADFKIASLNAPDHAETLAFAEESRALTKAQWAEYEEKRTSVTGPLNTALKTINGWFKPVQSCLKDMERLWNDKLNEARFAA